MAKVKVVILPDGKLTAYVDKADAESFEQAAALLRSLIQGAEQEGIEFDDIGQVEMHTHEAVGVQNKVATSN